MSLALLALLFFGGRAIHSFTATMLFGVVLVGTYTSIFIASPDPHLSRTAARRRDQGGRRAGAGGGGARLTVEPGRRFLPRRAGIDAYGAGGFRFADLSHRGSLLCLPSGMHAWPVSRPADLAEEAFAAVFAEADAIELLLVGTGPDLASLPEPLRQRFRDFKSASTRCPLAPPRAPGTCFSPRTAASPLR